MIIFATIHPLPFIHNNGVPKAVRTAWCSGGQEAPAKALGRSPPPAAHPPSCPRPKAWTHPSCRSAGRAQGEGDASPEGGTPIHGWGRGGNGERTGEGNQEKGDGPREDTSETPILRAGPPLSPEVQVWSWPQTL